MTTTVLSCHLVRNENTKGDATFDCLVEIDGQCQSIRQTVTYLEYMLSGKSMIDMAKEKAIAKAQKKLASHA